VSAPLIQCPLCLTATDRRAMLLFEFDGLTRPVCRRCVETILTDSLDQA
jgi:hypothetical protein